MSKAGRMAVVTGLIVKINSDESPWKDAEGLVIADEDAVGIVRVLWYKEPHMTLHWKAATLIAKDPQEFDPTLPNDLLEVLEKIKYYLFVKIMLGNGKGL